MNAAERESCRLTARWLRTARVGEGLALCVLALDVYLVGQRLLAPAALLALLPLLLAERYFAIRLRFDAEVFTDLADGQLPGLPSFDRALAQLGLGRATARERNLAERIAGARRLWFAHAGLSVLVLLVSVLALLWIPHA